MEERLISGLLNPNYLKKLLSSTSLSRKITMEGDIEGIVKEVGQDKEKALGEAVIPLENAIDKKAESIMIEKMTQTKVR